MEWYYQAIKGFVKLVECGYYTYTYAVFASYYKIILYYVLSFPFQK